MVWFTKIGKKKALRLNRLEKKYKIESAFGLDFGYTNDPSAMFVGFVDVQSRKIFVWDEMYEKGLSNKKLPKE